MTVIITEKNSETIKTIKIKGYENFKIICECKFGRDGIDVFAIGVAGTGNQRHP